MLACNARAPAAWPLWQDGKGLIHPRVVVERASSHLRNCQVVLELLQGLPVALLASAMVSPQPERPMEEFTQW